MPSKKDILCLTILITVITPFYLLSLDKIPFQVNTDEITIMTMAKRAVSERINIFGLNTGYFGFPWFTFYVFGKLGNFMGGINLYNMRLIHASSGILIVIISYIFFRSFWEPLYSLTGALVLGINHSLLAISRMAMRDNTGLLFEVLSFALLFHGLKKNSKLLSFLGGLAGGLTGGLTFYAYYPGRISFFIWLIFIGTSFYIFRGQLKFKKTGQLVVAGLFGFAIITAPLLWDTLTNGYDSFSYQKKQLLIFKEGRKLQQGWISAKTETEGVKKNILNGLKTFNSRSDDLGFIYSNYNHGFVDPLTGILIWAGLGIIFIKWSKLKTHKFGELFVVEGFFIIWFSLTFLTVKNPDYTRLLVILPFTAYLVTTTIKEISSISYSAGTVILIAIIISNLGIFNDFALKGLQEGHDIGGTARYIENKKEIPGYNFYLIADSENPYYNWGEPWQWELWLGFFAGPGQKATMLEPAGFLKALPKERPFTFFTNADLWNNQKHILFKKYPHLKIVKIKENLLAVEVY